MKAAVIYQRGEMPHYTEIPTPTVQNEGEVMMKVTAASIKRLDKARASGKHYSTENEEQKPTIIGSDGVGFLEDGTRIFAFGSNGMIAEKVVIDKNRMIKVPAGLDDATAAVLPNAVAGSAMALRFRAGMKPGETVLINGATSFTGKMAVQIARHYGAKRIIVTGRNLETLNTLLALGADEIILLNQEDEEIMAQLKAIHQRMQIDIVLDYLWGHSAELILSSLKGNGSYAHKTRFISIGAITGNTVSLSSEILRSTDLQLSGSGLGSWTKAEMQILFTEIIPEMFQLAADRQLVVDIETVDLKNIEQLWDREVDGGKRLVVVI